MCGPAEVAATAAVVSGAFTAHQQIQQGKFQRGVAEYNAAVAENEAQETREAGVEQENIHRRKTAELISRQRAQLGASNVDIGTGSALQLQEDALTLGEADALRIRSNTERQAEALTTGATLERGSGRFAEQAGRQAAVGTLIGSAGQAAGSGVADKWFTPDSAASQGLAGSPVNVGSTGSVGDPLTGVA